MASDVNPWHPVALGIDVPAGVTRAVILDGAEIVLWRGADGIVRAWEDRCPHRGMRLSYGFVRGSSLNCLYHGWEYDGSSSCIRIPAHPDLDVPRTIKATAYSVAEQDGLVWVSLRPARTDAPRIAGGPVTPAVSVAVERPAAVIREALGWPATSSLYELGGEPEMLVAMHPVSLDKVMLHGLVQMADATPDVRLAAAAWLRILRRELEAAREAA